MNESRQARAIISDHAGGFGWPAGDGVPGVALHGHQQAEYSFGHVAKMLRQMAMPLHG